MNMSEAIKIMRERKKARKRMDSLENQLWTCKGADRCIIKNRYNQSIKDFNLASIGFAEAVKTIL